MKSHWEGEVIRGLIGNFELGNSREKRYGDMELEHCAGVGCVLDFLLERPIDYGWPMSLPCSDRHPNERPLNPCRILRLVFPVHNRTHNLVPPNISIAD